MKRNALLSLKIRECVGCALVSYSLATNAASLVDAELWQHGLLKALGQLRFIFAAFLVVYFLTAENLKRSMLLLIAVLLFWSFDAFMRSLQSRIGWAESNILIESTVHSIVLSSAIFVFVASGTQCLVMDEIGGSAR